MQNSPALLETLGLLRLRVDHAVWGRLSHLEGRNRLPVNRLYYVRRTPNSETGGRIAAYDGCRELMSLDLREPSIYFMPKDVDLHFEFKDGLELIAFHFNLEILPGYDIFEEHTALRCLEDQGKMVDAAWQRTSNAASVGEIVSVGASIMDTAAAFIDKDLTDVRRQLSLRRKYRVIVDEVASRLSARLTVNELAQQAGVSRDTLSRSFARDIGMPLKSYLIGLLVRRSSGLLINTDMSITDLAASLDFSSQFYFSRFFRTHTGMTPTDYRAMYRTARNQ